MKPYLNLMTLCLFLFYFSNVQAQTAPQIRTGRPGQSIGPFVVGTGIFQVQSGIDSSWNQATTDETSLLLNNVIRFGFNESFEISGVVNLRSDKIEQTTKTFNQSGLSSLQLGFRYNIINEAKGLVPALGFQTRFKTRATSSLYRANNVAPIMILVSNHKLNNVSNLVINLGMNYDGQTPVVQYTYTASYSYSLSDHWGTFLEYYGNENSGLNKNYFDTGLSYLANKNLQWDLSFGGGKNFNVQETFVSFGISYRSVLL